MSDFSDTHKQVAYIPLLSTVKRSNPEHKAPVFPLFSHGDKKEAIRVSNVKFLLKSF